VPEAITVGSPEAITVEVDEADAELIDVLAPGPVTVVVAPQPPVVVTATGVIDIPPDIPTFGRLLFTPTEMDAWPNSGSVYSGTAASFVGNTSFVFTDFGTGITTAAEMDDFHEESVRGKGHACLWRADNNATRLAKAIEYFDCVKDITSIAGNSPDSGQDNLELSWALPNLVSALAIVGRDNYDNAEMDTFLRDVAYPMLDWYTGNNWFATFAASKLAIASYLEDQTLYDDAKGYAEFRCRQDIYHSTHDGSNINPILGSGLPDRLWPATVGQPPNQSPTSDHWWEADAGFSPYTAAHDGYTFEDGVDAEMIRDLSHESMMLTGFCQSALIIERTGDTVSTDMLDRITASAAWLGRRTLYYLQNATFEPGSPAGLNLAALNNYRYGWWTVKRLLGDATPAVIDDVLADPDITPPLSYGGQNHQTIEAFSEGTLV